jgi:hypothetical protein
MIKFNRRFNDSIIMLITKLDFNEKLCILIIFFLGYF